MHVQSSFVARKVLLLLAVFSVLQLACVGGRIPPSTFQFTIVLRERIPVALACDQFRKHMERILGDRKLGIIPGARVTGFQRVGVTRTTFPENAGSPPSP